MLVAAVCFSCDREQVEPSLLIVSVSGPPRRVCGLCFGTLAMRIGLSASCGCAGCDALTEAITDLLDQAEAGNPTPLSPNPQVAHDPARCLLWPDA